MHENSKLRTWGEHVVYKKCSELNNLSSYCGLVDAKIRASDKGLPVYNDFGRSTVRHIHHVFLPLTFIFKDRV